MMKMKKVEFIFCMVALFVGFAITVAISGCTTAPVPPVEAPAPAPVPKPPAPNVDVVKIMVGSDCSKVSYKNRGIAPIGYLKGMAQTYQRAICREMKMPTPASKELGDASKDALALYGLKGATNQARLKQMYTLLIGLGMRESSGNYGEGRDKSAENVASETAETGLFQFSFNLNSASPQLQKLYDEYRKHPENCMESTFKEGVKKPFNNNYSGVGAGLEFQKFARRCPAFAAEYTATAARLRVAHWGPLKRKEAEYPKSCEDILSKIELLTTASYRKDSYNKRF